jgi:hypothetical protein
MIGRRTRMRLLALVAVLGVAAAGVGLYLFQPWRAVTNREVQEALPAVDQLPAAAAPSAPPADGASKQPAAANQVLAGGAFVSHEHATRGSAQVVRLADGRHQLVVRDLDTSDGPDLRVWLTDSKVLPGRDGWHTFDDGRWVELGKLKGNRGNQVYDIPADADLASLRSVSIWCKRFAVSFGAAALETVKA